MIKAILLSAKSCGRNNIILKFYEPKSGKIILRKDTHESFVYCSMNNNLEGDRGYEASDSSKMNIIDKEIQVFRKVMTNNDNVDDYHCWEGDIRLHQRYLYDHNFNIGTWFMIDDDNISPAISLDKKNFKSNCNDLLGQEIPKFKRLAIDIEVNSDGNGIPDVTKASDKVTAIGFYGDDHKMVFVLDGVNRGEEVDCKITYFKFEKEMIKKAFEIMDQYGIILTFNGDNFDLPYLYNRSINLNVDYVPLIKFGKGTTFKNQIHLDLYGVYSNRSLKTYAFQSRYVHNGLDDIAKAMIGEGKIEHDFATISINKLGLYCLNDTRLTYQLSAFNNDTVMKLLVMLCRINNSIIDDVSRSGISTWIKNMLYYHHIIRNEIIPNSTEFPEFIMGKKANVKTKKYRGANVLKPQSGIHFNVTCLDFASLYPSIIQNKNMSYETVNCRHLECKVNKVPETNHWYCGKEKGLLPLLIGSLKELRVNHYKPMSKTHKDKNIRDQYKIIEQALKIQLNASYGVIGFEKFPLYYLPVSEGVTAFGRDIINDTINQCKAFNMNVLYSDTDSMFIKNPSAKQIDDIIKYCDKKHEIDLEVDKVYKYLVLSDRKKNYFGLKDDGNLDIKGLSGKKSHIPQFVKDLFENVMQDVKKINSPADFEVAKNTIRQRIKVVISDIRKKPLSDFYYSTIIKKHINEYKIKPQAIIAGEMFDSVEKEDEIKYIKTWKKCKVLPSQLAKIQDIDYGKYIELLEKVMSQILEPMNINVIDVTSGTKQTNLFQW